MACGAALVYRTGIGRSVTAALTRGLECLWSFSGPQAGRDRIDQVRAQAAAYAHRSYQPLRRICKSEVEQLHLAPATNRSPGQSPPEREGFFTPGDPSLVASIWPKNQKPTNTPARWPNSAASRLERVVVAHLSSEPFQY